MGDPPPRSDTARPDAWPVPTAALERRVGLALWALLACVLLVLSNA
ncbi:hypothetical protein [Engelhardtia mirabilis]|uniref:Uncharacterized protein n=1 Tax=Engelhardtia mirabilis TaxID=2528011 RepID=A0A518BFY4_9BACT|nr:hypothetical protein Pla133_08890 [Planctomycetes bacterium Pla133]QDV00149.1 hypothetical protein Pla86_08880 [Planctomycetes bacterium Pla86]